MREAEKEVLGKKHFPGITTLILQAAQRLRSYTVNRQMLTQFHTVVFCTIKCILRNTRINISTIFELNLPSQHFHWVDQRCCKTLQNCDIPSSRNSSYILSFWLHILLRNSVVIFLDVQFQLCLLYCVQI